MTNELPISSLGVENEHFGALLAAMGSSHEQFAPVGSEETSAGARGCCKMFDASVLVRAFLVEDIYKATAANYVDPLFQGVVEQIIGIVHDVYRGCLLSGFCIEHEHLGRRPAAYQNTVAGLIQSHGVVLESR